MSTDNSNDMQSHGQGLQLELILASAIALICFGPSTFAAYAKTSATMTATNRFVDGKQPKYAATFDAELIIEDGGGMNPESLVTQFKRQGDEYCSKNNQAISQFDLEELVKIIKRSEQKTEIDLQNIGVTPETARIHSDDILRTCTSLRKNVKKQEKLPSPMFNYPAACRAARRRLTAEFNDDDVSFKVSLNAPEICSEQIEVSSKHNCPWMLPWKVQIGNKVWNTYSTELPLIFAGLADPHGRSASLLDGREYWTNGFWSDGIAWWTFGRNLEKENAMEMAEQLSGYTDAINLFKIEDYQIGCINSQPKSLFLELKSRRPQIISRASWWNQLQNERPTANWFDMLQHYDEIRAIARKQRWLKQWSTCAFNHVVECNISGTKDYSEEYDRESIIPAWKNAGLNGKPTIELRLKRGRNWCGTVYLSNEDERGLVAYIQSGTGGHWLDRQNVSLTATKPTFLIVQPNGQFEKH